MPEPDRTITLTADELAGLERAIAPRVPGGELELGDAAVAAFELDCNATGSGYELTCDPDAVRALRAFVDDPDARLHADLDDDLDQAIDTIRAALDD